MPKRTKKAPKTRQPVTVLEMLTEAVGAFYGTDPCRAGVVISSLEDRDFYVSIVRYREAMGKGKQVVMSRRDPDLATAIRAVAGDWHTSVEKEIDRLRLAERSLAGLRPKP